MLTNVQTFAEVIWAVKMVQLALTHPDRSNAPVPLVGSGFTVLRGRTAVTVAQMSRSVAMASVLASQAKEEAIHAFANRYYQILCCCFKSELR